MLPNGFEPWKTQRRAERGDRLPLVHNPGGATSLNPTAERSERVGFCTCHPSGFESGRSRAAKRARPIVVHNPGGGIPPFSRSGFLAHFVRCGNPHGKNVGEKYGRSLRSRPGKSRLASLAALCEFSTDDRAVSVLTCLSSEFGRRAPASPRRTIPPCLLTDSVTASRALLRNVKLSDDPPISGALLDYRGRAIESDGASLLPLDGEDCSLKRVQSLLYDVKRVRVDELRPLMVDSR